MENELEGRIKKATDVEREVERQIGKNERFARNEDSLITFDHKIYVPPSLREAVLVDHHNNILTGHPGVKGTREQIKRQYWWNDLLDDIKRFVKGCTKCQQATTLRSKKAAPLHPMPIVKTPWEFISVDLIGPLPPSNGHNAIMVVVESYVKRCPECQRFKLRRSRPRGVLHPLSPATYPFER